MSGEFGSARQEAERLVATLLAMTSQSGPSEKAAKRDDDSIGATGARMVDGFVTLGNTLAGMTGLADKDKPKGFSTGSVECCICPICRTMASMRNPTPESAHRLATGAGDLASGVASMMRAFSAMSGTSRPAPKKRPAPTPPDPDLAWSAATRAGDPPPQQPADDSPWAAATREAATREAATREAATREAAEKREPQARTAKKPESHRPSGGGTDVWAAATNDEDR